MNNLTRILSVIVILTLIIACRGESTAGVIPTPAPKPKTFEITFNQTSFEVQFDKSLVIPFDLSKDEGHSVTVSLAISPSLGEITMNDNSIQYTPFGVLGEDILTLSIADNEKVVEQELEVLVSDRTPHMVLSEPIYGLSTELEDGVTVWGYNLGDQQNDSTIELCDLTGQCLSMPSIIHWKKTETNLPSTLDDLSASQRIQEVKFSIPETSNGDKYILISNQFGIATLPFTVRPKTFEVFFDETNFEVQFDQDLTIPLNISSDEGHAVITSISVLPSLGEVTIIDNKISYTPSGTLGKDSLTISITDNKKIIEQKLEFLVSDRAPHLAFSDLISGPSKGLGDKKGSGVIVTVWGFKLGDSQENSIIELCDLDNTCSEAAHVYYWKNADAQLPSGPANLYESHGMQEIAFSIPSITNGIKQIRVSNNYGTSTLPFTVRDGSIYHVTSQGNDDSGNGSFETPWLTVAKADSTIDSGSTLYIHNVTTGSEDTDVAIYNNKISAMSTLDAQFSYIAYPNTRPEVIAARGFTTYTGGTDTTAGFIVSKLSIFAAEADEDENNQPLHTRNSESKGTYAIEGTKDGRAIGNFITDAHPDDPSGACPDGVAAAITGGAKTSDKVSNFKVLGNHIKEYGCDGTTRFHHTTYLTIRSADKNKQLEAPEMGWNFLQDNKASSGLHYFDENNGGVECGQFTTPFNIHDNVVINQAGPAITFGANCPVNTTFNFYNNLAINVGIKADFDDTTTNGNITSAVYISIGHEGVTAQLNFDNNMFYQWNVEDLQSNLMACVALSAPHSNAAISWNSNICYTEQDLYFIRSKIGHEGMEAKFSGGNNAWYSEFLSPTRTVIPAWDTNALTNTSDISFDGVKLIIKEDSPLNNQVINSPIIRDIYGKLKMGPSTIGPVQASED